MVAKKSEMSEVFSTVYVRITRYCKPKAPPAIAATRMNAKPVRRFVICEDTANMTGSSMLRLDRGLELSPGEQSRKRQPTSPGKQRLSAEKQGLGLDF